MNHKPRLSRTDKEVVALLRQWRGDDEAAQDWKPKTPAATDTAAMPTNKVNAGEVVRLLRSASGVGGGLPSYWMIA